MALFRVGSLPEEPLTAAARFHAGILPSLIEALSAPASRHLTLVFEPASHTHRGWRLAVVQGLAREHAPLRINAIESDDDAAIAAAAAYLAGADAITGQFLPLDGMGAGKVV